MVGGVDSVMFGSIGLICDETIEVASSALWFRVSVCSDRSGKSDQ
jgi:hypothetical protein